MFLFFLFVASRTLLQDNVEFNGSSMPSSNRSLWWDFPTCYCCSYDNFMISHARLEWMQTLLLPECQHGTIIRTGRACKKIRCYMRNSACRWLIVEYAKYFKVMLNIFESSKVEKFESFHEPSNQSKLVPGSFSYFLELLWEENKF